MNLTAEALDREYNPRTQIADFAIFFSQWKSLALKARESTRAYLNISYGLSDAETLDYFPAGEPGAPLLLFIHGGYWRALDKADFSWIAPPYAAAGIAVAVVNYGLAPGTSISDIVGQIRRACVWAYTNAGKLNVDPTRIFCAGHSAGGHLTAMMLATEWPQLQPGLPRELLAGACAVSGLFDLQPLTRAEFIRGDLGLDEQGARRLSPCFLALRCDTPLMRAVGSLESNEFHRQSGLIAGQWPSACRRPLIEVGGCHHLSVCDALATPGNVLFETCRASIASGGDR